MKKILFVEDNTIAQSLIAAVFGGEYEIEIASDYVTAIEKINQGQYDLIVTDIFFPQETGSNKRELAPQLAERLRTFQLQQGIAEVLESLSNINFLKIKEECEDKIKYFGLDVAFSGLESYGKSIQFRYLVATKALNGIKGWESSSREEDQPLGVLIAEECEKREIPFRMASSLNHHSQMVEAVHKFALSRKWPPIFDLGNEEGNAKEEKRFWDKLKKEVH